jgi:hypothetical protein
VSEDESSRDRFQSDEAEDEGEDVEAHRKQPMTDDGDDADDVEAHRQHGGVGRQHGGA